MNKNLDFETPEAGIEKLKEHVALRNKMGGDMYWNMMNDECCQIANKITSIDPAKKPECAIILGPDTFN